MNSGYKLVFTAALWAAFAFFSGRPAASGFPAQVCAPYLQCWNSLSVTNLANTTGNKFWTMAFIVSDEKPNGVPCWFGKPSPTPMSGDTRWAPDFNNLRAMGGDVIISFGGMDGKELALVHSTASSLQAAYQLVITKYSCKWMDFDIEWGAIFDTAATTRRNKAIKNLQDANPGLKVSFTLGSLNPDSGMTNESLNLLKNAKANGVKVEIVNIMAMNYDPVKFCGDMGKYGIAVTNKTRSQVQSISLDARIGITPEVGVNTYRCEVFTLAHAQQMYNLAVSNSWVGLLSYWSIDNDASYAYLDVFKPFNSFTNITRDGRAGIFPPQPSIRAFDLAGRPMHKSKGVPYGAKAIVSLARSR